MRKVLVVVVFVLLLAGAAFGVRRLRRSAAAPTPTPAAVSPTSNPAAGEWVGVPAVIGTFYLFKCDGWSKPFVRLYPVPHALLTAAAASWPRKPAGFLAVSRSMLIPRSEKGVGPDIDAWFSPTRIDCKQDPWDTSAVKAIRGAKQRVGFFGIARPATREGKDVWEIAFAAILRSSGGGKR